MHSCLVVGLGNWNVTPDALGPQVCENLIVTRHLFELQPGNVEEGFRPVSALSPGVMGLTGIETSDIIFGVVEKTKPDFVIAIDALASRSIERVNVHHSNFRYGHPSWFWCWKQTERIKSRNIRNSSICHWGTDRCRCRFDYK